MNIVKVDTLDGNKFDVALEDQYTLPLLNYIEECEAAINVLIDLCYEYRAGRWVWVPRRELIG